MTYHKYAKYSVVVHIDVFWPDLILWKFMSVLSSSNWFQASKFDYKQWLEQKQMSCSYKYNKGVSGYT